MSATCEGVWSLPPAKRVLTRREFSPEESSHHTCAVRAARCPAGISQLLKTDDVLLVQGSWDDSLDCFADVNIAFAYTTAIVTDENDMLVVRACTHTRNGMLVVRVCTHTHTRPEIASPGLAGCGYLECDVQVHTQRAYACATAWAAGLVLGALTPRLPHGSTRRRISQPH